MKVRDEDEDLSLCLRLRGGGVEASLSAANLPGEEQVGGALTSHSYGTRTKTLNRLSTSVHPSTSPRSSVDGGEHGGTQAANETPDNGREEGDNQAVDDDVSFDDERDLVHYNGLVSDDDVEFLSTKAQGAEASNIKRVLPLMKGASTHLKERCVDKEALAMNLELLKQRGVRVHIVDLFNKGSKEARAVAKFFKRKMGLKVVKHFGSEQKGLTCGIIAAAAAHLIVMCAEESKAAIKRCADEEYVKLCGYESSKSCPMLKGEDVQIAFEKLSGIDRTNDKSVLRTLTFGVPYKPYLCDKIYERMEALTKTLRDATTKGGRQTFGIVSNTMPLNSPGVHWFTIIVVAPHCPIAVPPKEVKASAKRAREENKVQRKRKKRKKNPSVDSNGSDMQEDVQSHSSLDDFERTNKKRRLLVKDERRKSFRRSLGSYSDDESLMLPPTKAQASKLKFVPLHSPSEVRPTVLATKKVVDLQVRAHSELQGKLVATTPSLGRWVHLETGNVSSDKPSGGSAGVDFLHLQGVNRAQELSYVCPQSGQCSFHVRFKYHARKNGFVCLANRPHTCSRMIAKSERMSAHAFEAHHLAPVVTNLTSNKARKNVVMDMHVVQSALQDYLLTQPTIKFCRKVFNKALSSTSMVPTMLTDANRNAEVDVSARSRSLHQLDMLVRGLRKANEAFEIELVTVGKEEEKQILLNIAAHKSGCKNVDNFKVTAPLQAKLEAIDALAGDTQFYLGCVAIFPWANAFVGASLRAEGAVLACATDAGHCQGSAVEGTIYKFGGLDANRSYVLLAWAHFATNESNRTWDHFMQQIACHIPSLSDQKITIYRDGLKGISSALANHLPRARRFYCANHARDQAKQTVRGRGVGKAYLNMVHCLQKNRLENIQRDAFEKFPDLERMLTNPRIGAEERFLAEFAERGGKTQATLNKRDKSMKKAVDLQVYARTTSQSAESSMHSAKEDGSRQLLNPCELVRRTIETTLRQLQGRKLESLKCKKRFPPQVQKMLNSYDDKVNESGLTDVIFFPGNETAYVFTDKKRHPSRSVTCNVAQRLCLCNFTALTNFPCLCMAVMAKCNPTKVDIEDFVHEQDTTKTWQEQLNWDFDREMWRLGEASMCLNNPRPIDGQEPTLLMPVALPVKPGRPPMKRRRSATEVQYEQAKKQRRPAEDAAPKTPQRRPQTCRKCGQPRKGHTCPYE